MYRSFVALAALGAVSALPAVAHAESPFDWSAEYTVDIIGSVEGARSNRGFVLDDLSLRGRLDLGATLGLKGASIEGYVLNNTGDRPNDLVGTLEGFDNIEVGRARTRLFEFYLNQSMFEERGFVRLGFVDLNAEFYVTDSSGLLLGPPFGIGSELASTGANGPSIFPSTSLGAILKAPIGANGYAQFGVFEARSSSVGDPDGLEVDFRDGALVIAEAGLDVRGKAALGLWTYTDDQPDIRDLDANGAPVGQRAYGGYLLFERPLFADDSAVRRPTLFARLGASDGETTAFRGSGAFGMQLDQVFAGREDSALALGARIGVLGEDFRANLSDAGGDAANAEWGLEATYSDSVTTWLAVQPVVQVHWNSGGDETSDPTVVAGLRLVAAFGSE